MRRYDSYKDSGQRWLGEIPSHWEIKRLASYFKERRNKVSDKEYAPLSVTKLGIFPQWENVAKTNDGDNRKLVKAGDFVINSRSDRKGSSGISDRDGSVSLINTVLQLRSNIYPPFCHYLLKSYSFIEEYYRNGHGIVADLWTTGYDEMKMIKLAIPKMEEQKVISSYLDKTTSEIDKAIDQQQRMIDLLNERKQIIIQQAVTKGLNPNVKMKNSGVEWIGQVPKHWKISKIKFFIKIKSGEALSNEKLISNGDYIVYGGGEPIGYHSEYNVNPNSIIIGRVGARCGCVTIVKDYVWATDNALIVTTHNINNDYLALLLISADLNQLAATNAQPLLTGTKVKNTYIAIPPKEEQELIVKYINKHVKSIDVTKQRYEQQIDLLKERKQIIINDAVTGKIKII